MINNFNPTIMTSVRSNHDIKFIPSGKDGKNVAFYVTDYATKSELSTNQMVPLIAATKKNVDADTTLANSNMMTRSKAFLTKCLNRITTEKEISGSHVCHFLLGHLDKKTSHSFTRLNLHSALAWLADALRKYYDSDNANTESDDEREDTAVDSVDPNDQNLHNQNQNNNGDDNEDNEDNDNDDNDDDDDDDDDDDNDDDDVDDHKKVELRLESLFDA